jgi:hypothetical protein
MRWGLLNNQGVVQMSRSSLRKVVLAGVIAVVALGGTAQAAIQIAIPGPGGNSNTSGSEGVIQVSVLNGVISSGNSTAAPGTIQASVIGNNTVSAGGKGSNQVAVLAGNNTNSGPGSNQIAVAGTNTNSCAGSNQVAVVFGNDNSCPGTGKKGRTQIAPILP